MQLVFFELAEATMKIVTENKELYTAISMNIIDELYALFFDRKKDLIGINSRIKSPESLKEKIIRKKLYKTFTSAEELLDNMPDVIGIMIECEFIEDEELLFNVIKDHFYLKHDNGYSYNENTRNLFVNLEMQQPIIQKNGNELYKLDCYYQNGDIKVNFELQIKSLVNSFWCEVEHNIVYKNDYYIPNDEYIKEMLSAIRINLISLDKMLHLLSNRVNTIAAHESTYYSKLIEDTIKQYFSNSFNTKMLCDIGFTIDINRPRDLLSRYVLSRIGGIYEVADLLMKSELNGEDEADSYFSDHLFLESEFESDSIFSQMVGNKLLTLINKDFEWHTFFAMLFITVSRRTRLENFNNFVTFIKNLYINYDLFKTLSQRGFSEDEIVIMREETEMFIGEAICTVMESGIMPESFYNKINKDVEEFLTYTINCMDNFSEWVKKRSALQSVLYKSITRSID